MKDNSYYEYPSTSHHATGYPYRVWIFTILLTPLIYECRDIILGEGNFIADWLIRAYLYTIGFIALYTALPMVIYIVVFWVLIDSRLSPILIKLLLISTAIIGVLPNTMIVCFFFGGKLSDVITSDPAIIFCSTITILSLFFSLKE